MSVNTRFQKIAPSATLAVKAKANELKAAGKPIFDFSTGEPDFDTPDHIKEAAKEALAAGKTKYTAVPGIPELRAAVAEKFKIDNGLEFAPEQVIISNGGKQAIYQALAVTVEPGDEVVLPAPYWVSYPVMAELAGAKPVIVQTTPENAYKMQPEQLKEALTEKTRWVVFNSPSNPTGMGYTKKEQEALAAVLADHHCLILSDEVYEKLVYDDFQFVSFAAVAPELASRTITVNACSKAYSMTGWRVGYAAGDQSIIKAMSKYQSQTTSNVNSIAQHAAIAALTGDQGFLKKWCKAFNSRIEKAMSLIEGIPGLQLSAKPNGAFYLFIEIASELQQANALLGGSSGLAQRFIEDVGVAVVPGEAFGDDRAFRISVACSPETITQGLGRIEQLMTELIENKRTA